MNSPMERELKILVSKDIYEKIVKSYDFTIPQKQINTYYDTQDHALKQLHGACRIRTIGTAHIFTLKVKKDEITHLEFEKIISVDCIDQITDPEIHAWLKRYQIRIKDLYEIASFSTVRQTCDLASAQLCADKTIYDTHIDYEIEYEYTKEHNGTIVFNQILAPYDLTYIKNCPSKIARAFDL